MSNHQSDRGEWLTYSAPSGEIRAFAMIPSSPPPWPALIVIHGVNGCGPHMEAKVAEFAKEGYFAIAPDIYTNDRAFRELSPDDILEAAHMGPNPAKHEQYLAGKSPQAREGILRARAWANARPSGTYIEIIRACFDYLKQRADVAAIGSVGYCMGGRLTGELAVTGVDLSAGVIYYGGNPKLDLVPNIRCPIQGHYATTDHAITDKVPAFADAMKQAGKEFTYFVYDADHGFSLTPGSHGYSEEATRQSMTRVLPFLGRTLKSRVLIKV